jgi:hypothetical protein
MSLILQGSTSGSVTLQEPAVAGTTVLDLPAVSGTILTTTSPKAGNVIQVVQGTATNASTTSSTFVTTNLSASITPSASSSKILILAVLADVYNASTAQAGTFTIVRGSTNIAPNGSGANQAFAYYWTNASGPFQTAIAFNYLDSPSTTSSTTYTIHFATAGGTLYTSINGQTNTITLMEIAA